jgi:hypothetical protein
MVLGTWTKKTITSVLATRMEDEVSNAKSNNLDEDEEEGGVGADDGGMEEYDTDSDNCPMYNSGKWMNLSATTNTGTASDVDDGADAEASVAPPVAESGKELDPLLSSDKESGDDKDDHDDEQSNDSKYDDVDREMNNIIHSLDAPAGRRTTTMKGTKAGTKTTAMPRTARVAETTLRKRKATGSSGASKQARKGLRQR